MDKLNMYVVNNSKIFKEICIKILLLFLLVCLFYLGLKNYIFYNNLVELLNVVLGLSIAIVAVNTHNNSNRYKFLFIGISYFFVSIFYFLHLMAHLETSFLNNLSTLFIIVALYIESTTFLVQMILIGKKKNSLKDLIFYFVFLFFSLLVITELYWFFINGPSLGLAFFRTSSFYIISVIFITSIYFLNRNKDYLDNNAFNYIKYAAIFKLLSTLILEPTLGSYDLIIILGQLFRLISFYLLFRGIVKIGFKNPYKVIDNKNEILEAILNSTTDAILVTNQKREVIHFNNEFINLWGIPEEILESKDDRKLVEFAKSSLVDPDKFVNCLEGLIRDLKASSDTLYFKDERIIERRYNSFILDNENKGIVWTFRDITERKNVQRLEQENIKKEIELQRSKEYDELRTQFFSSISHDFKTPLNILLGGVQLLNQIHQGSEDCPNHRSFIKYTRIMRQNCYRLLRLINNLIDITRADTQYLKINLVNLNIVQFVEEIVESISGFGESKGIRLIFDTDIEDKIMAVDPDMIERIMLNFLSNSLKFTGENGTIEVTMTNHENGIEVSIKDNGLGIPEENLEDIFERYKQVKSILHRKNEGTGIGLALVKTFIELHNGKISVKSEVGKGAEFIIYLPSRIVDKHIDLNDEISATREVSIERINVEFSDIYQ